MRAPSQAVRHVGIPDSPYLTLEEGARHCRFDTCAHPVVAFRKWARRQGLPIVRRGRVLLVDRRVLDAFLEDRSRDSRKRG